MEKTASVTSSQTVREMPEKKRRRKIRPAQAALHIVLFLLLLLTLFPFYVMIVNSFKTPTRFLTAPLALPDEWVFSYYRFAWAKVSGYFLNTIVVAAAEVVLATLINSMAAYGFTRFRFKGREALFMAILAIMMIPGVLTLIPQYVLVHNMGLTGSLWGIILPQLASPFNIFLLKNFFAALPQEVFESAEMDGASGIRKYFTFAIPLSKPILFTVALTTLMGCWNDLIWPRLILLKHEDLYTISVGIMELTNSYGNESFGMGVPLAAYGIASLPLLIAFFFTSKQFISGLTSGALKM